MQVTRIRQTRHLNAPNHTDHSSLGLQGAGITKTGAFWCGLSHYLPGGRAHRGASDYERVYVVLEGEITIATDEGTAVLGPLDSVHIAPREQRMIENTGPTPTAVLVVVANAKPSS